MLIEKKLESCGEARYGKGVSTKVRCYDPSNTLDGPTCVSNDDVLEEISVRHDDLIDVLV